MTRKQNDSAKKRLVVLLHAYSHQAQDLDSIKRTISREWPQAIFYTPDMPASIFSMHDPNRIALTILQGIDRLVKQAETSADEIDEIIFVGHSLGSLLARKVYIAACGELESAPLEPVYHELESCGSWDVSQATMGSPGFAHYFTGRHEPGLARIPSFRAMERIIVVAG